MNGNSNTYHIKMYSSMYQGLAEVGLQACRACLATDVKLHNLHEDHLADAFADITKTPVFLTDGLPQHICYMCHSQLSRCLEFRDRCRQALMILQDLRTRQLVVKTDHVRQTDTSKFVAKITRSEVLTMDCVPEYDIFNQEQHPVPIPNIISNETEVKEELVNYEDHIQSYEVKDDSTINICHEDLLNTPPKSITYKDVSLQTEATTNDDEFKMDQDLITISDDDDIITKIEAEDIKLRYDNHVNSNSATIVCQEDQDAVNKLLVSKQNVKCNKKTMEIETEDIKLRYGNHANSNSATIVCQEDQDAVKKLLASKKNVKCNRKMIEIEAEDIKLRYDNHVNSNSATIVCQEDQDAVNKLLVSKQNVKCNKKTMEIETEDIKLRYGNHANSNSATIVCQEDQDAVNKLLASKQNVKCNRKTIEIETEDNKLRYGNHANSNSATIVCQEDLEAVKKLLASKKNVKCNRKMVEMTHDESATKDKITKNVNKKKNIIGPKKQAKVEKPKIVKKIKRKRMYNQKYIEDYDEFAKEYNIEVVMLSKTEQKRRIEERKALADCVKNRLTCEVCYKGFMTEQAYERHMKFHDPSYGKFQCEVCQRRFPERVKHDRHVRGHRKEFICRICNQKHTNVCYNTHVNHIRETHTPVSCKDCGESFEGTTLLNKHRDTTHTQCQTCNAVFRRAVVLQKHTDEGCRPDSKPCTECGASFNTELELSQHRQAHDLRSRFQCQDCKLSFPTDRSLGIHWAAVHTNEHSEDKRSEDKLTEHERSEGKRSEHEHREGKRSEDERNEDKQFEDRRSEDEPSEGNRSEHKPGEDERIEGNRSEDERSEDERSEDERSEDEPSEESDDDAPLARRYVCDVCAGSYKNKITLRLHKRSIHEGHKVYKKALERKCPQCDETFATLTNLKVRKCPQCDETFATLTNLKIHLTYHKGVGPYLCRFCPETFKTYETKTKHIRENHSKNCPYKCSMCAEFFVNRRHLETHVLHRHLRANNDPTTP